MTIKNDLYFVYDGKTSKEMGLINVNINSGMFQESFMAEQSIEEETVRNNDIPYFNRVTKTPFTLDLTFAFEDRFTEERLLEVADWLGNQPYYKELYFSDNTDKRYFVMYSGSSDLVHNGLQQGYITLTMRSISPYTYSPVLTEGVFDFSGMGAMGENVEIFNRGSMTIFPLIEIKKVGAGRVEIINYSQADNSSFVIQNLADKEIVTIDCENEDIVSDIPLTYHFDDVIGNFTSFVKGKNYLMVKGACYISFKYRCVFNNL